MFNAALYGLITIVVLLFNGDFVYGIIKEFSMGFSFRCHQLWHLPELAMEVSNGKINCKWRMFQPRLITRG